MYYTCTSWKIDIWRNNFVGFYIYTGIYCYISGTNLVKNKKCFILVHVSTSHSETGCQLSLCNVRYLHFQIFFKNRFQFIHIRLWCFIMQNLHSLHVFLWKQVLQGSNMLSYFDESSAIHTAHISQPQSWSQVNLTRNNWSNYIYIYLIFCLLSLCNKKSYPLCNN